MMRMKSNALTFASKFICLSLIFLGSCALGFATLYDEEAQVSGQLQDRLQKELDRVLGRGRSSVLIRVELMMDPVIREAIRKAVADPARQSASAGNVPVDSSKTKPEFIWKGEKTETNSFVLPGFNAKKKDTGPAPTVVPQQPSARDIKTDPSLVLAAGTLIKKINVKISIDQDASQEEEKLAYSIAADFVGAEYSRGDSVAVERVALPSAWKEMLSDPEKLSNLAAKAIAAGAAILIMLLIARSIQGFSQAFTRAADKLSQGLQRRNVSIDVENKGKPLSGGILDAENLPGLLGDGDEVAPSLASGAQPGLPHPAGTTQGAAIPQNFVFDVKLPQVNKLYQMLHKEDPENIALVVSYLTPDVKKAFLSMLSPETTVNVLNCISSVRFLEPEMILRLKSELEHRLQGAVGGIDNVVELLESVNEKTRKQLLEMLEKRNSGIAVEVRRRIFFFEDVLKLADGDLRTLLANCSLEDISTATALLPSTVTDRILACMAKKTAAVLKEAITFRANPQEEKIFEAQERVLRGLKWLVQQNKVKNPSLSEPKMLS